MVREKFLNPDHSKQRPRGSLWCVYCNDWKEFNKLVKKNSNYDRCVGCSISTEDYDIKSVNDLWQKDAVKVGRKNTKKKTEPKKPKREKIKWETGYV